MSDTLGWLWGKAFVGALAARENRTADLLRMVRYGDKLRELAEWAAKEGPPAAFRAVQDARLAHHKMMRGIENRDERLVSEGRRELRDAYAVIVEHVDA